MNLQLFSSDVTVKTFFHLFHRDRTKYWGFTTRCNWQHLLVHKLQFTSYFNFSDIFKTYLEILAIDWLRSCSSKRSSRSLMFRIRFFSAISRAESASPFSLLCRARFSISLVISSKKRNKALSSPATVANLSPQMLATGSLLAVKINKHGE